LVAAVDARSVPCREIGGDFFDVALTSQGLAAVVADVSGKGISAALLASTLQGLIYFQLMASMPLVQVAAAVNAFLCQKRLEAKYATLPLMVCRWMRSSSKSLRSAVVLPRMTTAQFWKYDSPATAKYRVCAYRYSQTFQKMMAECQC
jgi:hypothetical protein